MISKYLIILCLYEISFLIIARLLNIERVYFTAAYEFKSFVFMVVVLLGALYLVKIFSKVKMPSIILKRFKASSNFFILVSLVAMLSFLALGDQNFRYGASGTSAVTVFVHYVSSFSKFIALLVILKKGTKPSKVLIFFFIVFSLATADGLSSVLIFFCMVYLIATVKYQIKPHVLFLFVPMLVYFGIHIKWGNGIPISYIEFYEWVVSRFAIPAETTYLYVTGLHYLDSTADSIAMIGKTLGCRFSFIIGGSNCFGEIRSIGGANYFSLYGLTKGGSSPGFMGSVIFLSFYSVPILFLMGRLLKGIFRFLKQDFGWFGVAALVMLSRPIYGDFPDFLSVMSLNTLYYLGMLSFFCLFRVRF